MNYSLEKFGFTKAGLKRRAENHGYFEDLRNNPLRQEAKDLLDRRGSAYTLAECRTLVEHLGMSSHDECILDNPDDFTHLEIWRAKDNEKRYNRALRLLERAEKEAQDDGT
jgi:hypothetical protein